jgi:hypothetical protein
MVTIDVSLDELTGATIIITTTTDRSADTYKGSPTCMVATVALATSN